jgi:hypothetical protein
VALLIGTHASYTERQARGFRVLTPGVQGPNVAPPGTVQRIVTRQELPDHPRSVLRAGITGPDVNISITNRILTRQEVPGHPASRFHMHPANPVQPSHRPALIRRQEMPDHPRSIFHAGTPPISYEDVHTFFIL